MSLTSKPLRRPSRPSAAVPPPAAPRDDFYAILVLGAVLGVAAFVALCRLVALLAHPLALGDF